MNLLSNGTIHENQVVQSFRRSRKENTIELSLFLLIALPTQIIRLNFHSFCYALMFLAARGKVRIGGRPLSSIKKTVCVFLIPLRRLGIAHVCGLVSC